MTLTRAFISGIQPPVRLPGITFGLLLLLVIALSGCARNPVSGRPEPVLITERGEIEQGNRAARQVEKQIGLVDDPKLQAYIDELGQRLAAHSPRKKLEYHFYVVEMVEPNAFALPGGHVYISRGLLTLPNSEDALAAILGHEIGHVAARHSIRRQTARAPLLPLQIATVIGGAATAIVSPRLGQLLSHAGQLPGAFALAAYNREQEREADALGQQIAAAAGFDPQALARFMRTLALEEKLAANQPERRSFFDSHPPSPQRSIDAEKYGRDLAAAEDGPPPLSRRAFLAKLEGIVVGDGASEGVFVGNEFLHPELRIGFELPREWDRINTPRAVISQRKDGLALIVVELVGKGEEPMKRALAFDRQVVSLDAAPIAMEISGLNAVQGITHVGGRSNPRKLLLTWIAYDGLIYRIAAATDPHDFAAMRPTFDQTVLSFHALSKEQLRNIRENRLRIVVAEPSERLEALSRRNGNDWSLEQTAIANALEPDARVGAGRLVKISHPESYVPRAKSPGPVQLEVEDATGP